MQQTRPHSSSKQQHWCQQGWLWQEPTLSVRPALCTKPPAGLAAQSWVTPRHSGGTTVSPLWHQCDKTPPHLAQRERCHSRAVTALALRDGNSRRLQQHYKVSWFWVITRIIISTTSLLSDIIFSHRSLLLLPNWIHASTVIGSEGTRKCPLSGRVSSKQSINAKEKQSAVSITAPGWASIQQQGSGKTHNSYFSRRNSFYKSQWPHHL